MKNKGWRNYEGAHGSGNNKLPPARHKFSGSRVRSPNHILDGEVSCVAPGLRSRDGRIGPAVDGDPVRRSRPANRDGAAGLPRRTRSPATRAFHARSARAGGAGPADQAGRTGGDDPVRAGAELPGATGPHRHLHLAAGGRGGDSRGSAGRPGQVARRRQGTPDSLPLGRRHTGPGRTGGRALGRVRQGVRRGARHRLREALAAIRTRSSRSCAQAKSG